MKPTLKLTAIRLALIASLTAAISSSYGQGAVATISDVQVGGNFDYTILLHNTGSTSLNSFWYGWTQSGNNLPSVPSGPTNSLGWGNNIFGNSIKWINSSGTALAAGQTATFFFVSSSTPAQITTLPSGDSVAYINGIDNSQNVPGDSTPVFAPAPVPEPSSLVLLATGAVLLAGIFRRKSGRDRLVLGKLKQ
jgi:hypothetical protein